MGSSLHEFIQNILLPTQTTQKEQEFLCFVCSQGGNYTDFEKILEAYPDKKLTLLKMANATFKEKLSKTITSSHQALSLFGYFHARNSLALSIVNKNLKIKEFSESELKKALPYVAKAQEKAQDYHDEWFLAGLAFDFAHSALLNLPSNPSFFKDPNDVQNLLKDIWEHGVAVTRITLQLHKGLAPKSKFEKNLIQDALLHDIGKAFIPFFRSNTNHPEKMEESQPLLADQNWDQEEKNYLFRHDTLGFFFLMHLGFFPETQWTVLFHHQPFLAKKRGTLIHQRTQIVWLADHLHKYRIHHARVTYPLPVLESWYRGIANVFPHCTLDQFLALIKNLNFFS